MDCANTNDTLFEFCTLQSQLTNGEVSYRPQDSAEETFDEFAQNNKISLQLLDICTRYGVPRRGFDEIVAWHESAGVRQACNFKVAKTRLMNANHPLHHATASFTYKVRCYIPVLRNKFIFVCAIMHYLDIKS